MISSHILSEIALLADDIGIIDHGVLLEELSLKELEKKNSKYVHFIVSDTARAARLLEKHLNMFNFYVEDQQSLRLHDMALPVSAITRLFIENGIDVSESHTCEDTLEDYFKKITGGWGLLKLVRCEFTLKNLRTIPVSATRMVTAKIIVLFILGLIFSLTSVAASMLGGAFAGNIQGVLEKLWISAADGILLTARTLPVVIAIVFFNRSYIFSIILAFFYTILNFSMAFVGLQYDTPMMKLLTSILPTPIIYRWLLGLFTSPADSFYAIIAPKILPLPQVVIIIAVIALISYMAIVRIYRKRED